MKTNAKKLALAATAVAATQAPAAVIMSPTVGSGLTPPPSNGVTNWDVDNDGTVDFALRHNLSTFSTTNRASFDDRNGGRLVVPTAAPADQISKLGVGFVVGATMAGAKFHAAAQATNTMTNNGNIGGDANAAGWAKGDTGYFGFKFTNGTGTHYGWGELTISGSPVGQGFKLNRAYYESIADQSITVVPEPMSVAAYALGALATAGYLRRRRQAGA